MLNPGAWIIFPLLVLPLAAQDVQVLPIPAKDSPPVDMITPVPAPVIPFASPGTAPQKMPENLKIESNGPIVFQKDVTWRYEGPGVKVSGDNGMEIFADSAVIDFAAKTATLQGHVSVYQGNLLQRGDRAVYYYERKFLDASGLRASIDPLLLEAGKFTVEQRGDKMVYVGENAGITTDDEQDPNYWIRAKKTTIFPGEKIVFKDLKLYAGDTPVFWLPYLSQPLDADLGYHFIPGSRSNWGLYLLNTYGIMLGGDYNADTGENDNAWLLSRWHFDLRSSRGLGTGVDLLDTRLENQDELTGLSLYYLYDFAPDTERSGVPRGFVDENRYRVQLKHRIFPDFPDPDGDWRIDSNLSLLSDEHYLEDFGTVEYRTDPFPDNTLGIYRRDDQSLLSIFARFRINDFYRTDTRLPAVAFDQARAPLFGLPILHEGRTSLEVIGEQAADPTRKGILNPLLQMTSGDPAAAPLLRQLTEYERQLAAKIISLPLGDKRREAIETQLLDASYLRFNTYQELSMPFTVGNFLNIAPQAGVGFTSYNWVDGPIDSSTHSTLHAGVEASVKFSKDLGDYQNHNWGINGLKHVLQPYAFWSVVSSDDVDLGDPMVDRLTATTRPRPLDPVRFTAVDELQSWNVVRLGARNRLLTQRDHQSYEWLFVDTYIDAFINDPEGRRNWSNLYNDVTWRPLPWMSVDVETQIPVTDSDAAFSEFGGRMRIQPWENMEFSVGYRYLASHPVLQDSNQIDFQAYYRINENWGMGTRHVFEMDDGTLELEQYTLHRDLGNWAAGVGLTHRNNRLEEEYGVVFSLTLKDFPSVSLPFQIDAQ